MRGVPRFVLSQLSPYGIAQLLTRYFDTNTNTIERLRKRAIVKRAMKCVMKRTMKRATKHIMSLL